MARELNVGAQIGEYRVKRVLGQGGFGITYLAEDDSLDRLVAIKEYFPREFARRESGQTIVPNSDDQDRADFEWGMKHFVEEARNLTRFKHKNIVGAIRFLRENGTAYLVMEYCDGESLEDLAKRSGPIPERVLRPILNQLLDGLEEVHRSRLLHLDIKPSNIFIKADGTLVLLDFGSARQSISSHSKSVKVASAGYAAIEQESADIDAGKLGPWTDVYGLGATLYRLITGNRLPQATARLLQESMSSIYSADHLGYDNEFLAAVEAAIRIKPQDRPQSVAEFRALTEKSATPSASQKKNSGVLVLEDDSSSWRAWALAAVVLLGAVLIWGVSTNDNQTSEIADSSPPVELPDDAVINSEPQTANNSETKSGLSPCPTGMTYDDWANGTLRWSNCFGSLGRGGHKFVGTWMNGQPFEGTETYADSPGDRYVGRFKNNSRHGRGKYFGSDGYRYEGQWRDGKQHGYGAEIYSDGNRFEGNFKDGRWQGRGVIRFASGQRYEGNFENGSQSGSGVIFFTNGDRLSAQFADGKANGPGTYTWATGSKFVGTYVDGKATGSGVEYDAAGSVVRSGLWVDGEFVERTIANSSTSNPPLSQPKNLYIEVRNSTNYEIRYLYVKPLGEDRWGGDRLGSRTLKKGETYRVELPNSVREVFDVRLCDSDGDEYVVASVNAVTQNVTATLTNLTRQKC